MYISFGTAILNASARPDQPIQALIAAFRRNFNGKNSPTATITTAGASNSSELIRLTHWKTFGAWHQSNPAQRDLEAESWRLTPNGGRRRKGEAAPEGIGIGF